MSCDTIKFYAELNYEIISGDDFTDSFVLQDDSGNPINITDLAIALTLKADQADTATVAAATITQTDAPNGEFNTRISSDTLDGLERNKPYYLKLEIDDGANTITRLKGQLTIIYA